jgi:hypothetical protein
MFDSVQGLRDYCQWLFGVLPPSANPLVAAFNFPVIITPADEYPLIGS